MGFLSGFFKSKTKTTKTKAPFETNPWKTQQPYIQKGFEEAEKALGGANTALQNTGDLQPDFNKTQQTALNQMASNGFNFNQNFNGSVNPLLQQRFQQAGNYNNPEISDYSNFAQQVRNGNGVVEGAQNIVDGIQGQDFRGASDDLMNRATGLFDQSGNIYSDITNGNNLARTNQVFDDVSGNKTNSIIDDANKYANSSLVQGQIDSAIGDVRRGFDIQKSGINANATAGGNANSSRTGTLEAYALKDAQDRAGDISSGMRSEALNRGFSLAAAAEANRQGNSLNANGQLIAGDNSRIGNQIAASGLGLNALQTGAGINSQAVGGDKFKTNALLDANASLRSAHGFDLDANNQVGQASRLREDSLNSSSNRFTNALGDLGTGYNQGHQGLSDSLYAGDRQQQQEQQKVAAQLQKAGMPLNMVQQYMQIIGGNYGNSGYTTNVSTQKSASPFQQLVGGASSLIGAAAKFKNPLG